MKKKLPLMSFLMAMFMMAMCPQSAWADVVEVSTADELASAIGAGGSFKMTADISTAEEFYPTKDFEIDLNGHTLTSTSSDASLFSFRRATTSTLKNGTITSASSDHIIYSDDNYGIPTVNLEGLTMISTSTADGNHVIYVYNGVFNVSNCTISTTAEWAYCINSYSGTINVSNSDFSAVYFGLYTASGTINILGGVNVTIQKTWECIDGGSLSAINFLGTCDMKRTSASTRGMISSYHELSLAYGYKFVNADGEEVNIIKSGSYYKNDGSLAELKVVVDEDAVNACAQGSHTMQHTEAVAATCTETGLNEYYYCTTCKRYYADAEGATLYANKLWPSLYRTSEALGHDYNADGVCTRCGTVVATLVEGDNTGLTFAAISTSSKTSASDFNLYRFVAPGDGTLTVSAQGDGDTYGALFTADKSTMLTYNDDDGIYNNFLLSYTVTKGTVYYIGARAYNSDTELTNYNLYITGTWPQIVTFELNDGEDYVTKRATVAASDETFVADEFTYNRTFANTTYNALYVPFTMQYSDWSDKANIYKILNIFEEDTDNDDKIDACILKVARLEEGESIKANTPYVIKPKAEGEMTITLADVTLEPAEENSIWCASTDYKFVFKGNYSPVTIAADSYYFMSTTGELQYSATDVTLNAQRWSMAVCDKETDDLIAPSVFTQSSSSDAKRIVIIADDEDATSITSYDNDNDNAKQIIYNVNGQRLNSPVKGINIINGRKVLIK